MLGYMKFRPVVQEEMSFNVTVYGRRMDGRTMDDGQRPIITAHLELSAQVS